MTIKDASEPTEFSPSVQQDDNVSVVSNALSATGEITDALKVTMANQTWKWRMTLSTALFIPIFLETLDYTGE